MKNIATVKQDEEEEEKSEVTKRSVDRVGN